MKKFFCYFLILILSMTNACTSASKKTSDAQNQVPAETPIEQTSPAEIETSVGAPTVSIATTKSNLKNASTQNGSSPEENLTDKNEISVTDIIRQARQHQTLEKPASDVPAFKDEEIISLKGRHVSPMAYEPVTQTPTAAPWSGEELKYGVYYSFVKAGTAYIKNRGLTTVNGRQAYLIQTTAFSASVIDKVFKVRDINYSWIDATDFYSLGYTQSLREGSYVRDEWVNFDYPNQRYYGEVKKKKEPREISGDLPTPVLDILSALYYVRTHDLQVGQDIVFDIVNREETYPLVVKVLKKDKIKTPAGKFDCVVVEPQFRGEGIFVSKGKSLKVWLTDDAYKMPVKMQTEVFIGSVSAELLEYKRN